jgi:hypothetical protein
VFHVFHADGLDSENKQDDGSMEQDKERTYTFADYFTIA